MNTERIWSAKLQPIRSCLTRFIDHIDRSDPHSDSSCVFTGLTDLDYYMSPMRPGEICIIAARPSIGKTALTENIIEHAVVLAEGSSISIEVKSENRTCGYRRKNTGNIFTRLFNEWPEGHVPFGFLSGKNRLLQTENR